MTMIDPKAQRKLIVGGEEVDGLRDVSTTLRAAGYSVVSIPTSTRIFRMVKKDVPDLIILSGMLKDQTGIEAARILVEKLNYTNPILMVSSETSEQMIMKAYEAGVSEYLSRTVSSRFAACQSEAAFAECGAFSRGGGEGD